MLLMFTHSCEWQLHRGHRKWGLVSVQGGSSELSLLFHSFCFVKEISISSHRIVDITTSKMTKTKISHTIIKIQEQRMKIS